VLGTHPPAVTKAESAVWGGYTITTSLCGSSCAEVVLIAEVLLLSVGPVALCVLFM
jgi:hypothetical protein